MTQWFKFYTKKETEIENMIDRGSTLDDILVYDNILQEIMIRNKKLVSLFVNFSFIKF